MFCLTLAYLFNEVNNNFIFYSLFKTFYLLIVNFLNNYTNFFFIILVFFFFKNFRLIYIIGFFFFLNLNNFTYFFYYNTISKSLLIGYNNIHPLVFYFSFIFGVLSGVYRHNFKFISLLAILFCAILALLLGGLWGLGNSIWGFFWVNDSIELVLLYSIVVIIFSLHTFLLFESRFLCLLCFFILVINIIAMRWGFFFTRHSFFNLNKLKNIFFLFVIFFLSFYLQSSLLFFGILKFIKVLLVLIVINSLLRLKIIVKHGISITILHIIIFIFLLTWIKFRENNIVFFVNTCSLFSELDLVHNLYLSSNVLFYKNKIYFLTNMVLWSFSYYNYKYIINSFFIYVSYYLLYLWYFMLVSMYKIYVR